MFSNSLIQSTTVIVLEEYIQENTNLVLTREKEKADIIVYPYFLRYIRPNTEITFAMLSAITEEVGLEMLLLFQYPKYNFIQQLQSKATIEKNIKSNFLSINENLPDFANSIQMNLVKKTINNCFINVDELIF